MLVSISKIVRYVAKKHAAIKGLSERTRWIRPNPLVIPPLEFKVPQMTVEEATVMFLYISPPVYIPIETFFENFVGKFSF